MQKSGIKSCIELRFIHCGSWSGVVDRDKQFNGEWIDPDTEHVSILLPVSTSAESGRMIVFCLSFVTPSLVKGNFFLDEVLG